MNKNELIDWFRDCRENGENEKIIEAVMALPDSALDDDILTWLAKAYIDIGECKKAIAVLESQRARLEDDYKWHFRMGLALMQAADDEECEDDDELRRNILERAKVAWARGMNMNPPEDALTAADRYMEHIEDELDELRDDDYDDEEEDNEDADLYDEEELDAIEDHIKEYYGDFPTVFHELSSPDIHCDVCIVPPSEERNYYSLITMGMGARIMNIPDSMDPSELGRAELIICLPPDWKLGENSEEWFWPISLLKNIARLPINADSWIGWGHSIDHQSSFAENTELCGSLLIYPENVPEGAEVCTLPNGDSVNFFEVIPLYREEMQYKIDVDTHALLERMQNVSHIVNINRPNCCEGYSRIRSSAMDDSNIHSNKILVKRLPLDTINGCNHISAFMRWCIEHDLTAAEFPANCPEAWQGVVDGTRTDLREFINDYFDGKLELYQMNFIGGGFLHYYYNRHLDDPEHFYPADVDSFAEKYFGTERYNSEEFKDEAYLFVPFDEDYYNGISEYIERAFNDFYPPFEEYQFQCDLKTARCAELALGLKTEVVRFASLAKQNYKLAVSEAKFKECTPVIMIIDNSGTAYTKEDLEDLLIDLFDPFLETLAIAHIPTANPMDWVNKYFGLEKPEVIPTYEDLNNACRKAIEFLGTAPMLLTNDEERATLFVPLDGGQYVRFSGRGFPKNLPDEGE